MRFLSNVTMLFEGHFRCEGANRALPFTGRRYVYIMAQAVLSSSHVKINFLLFQPYTEAIRLIADIFPGARRAPTVYEGDGLILRERPSYLECSTGSEEKVQMVQPRLDSEVQKLAALMSQRCMALESKHVT